MPNFTMSLGQRKELAELTKNYWINTQQFFDTDEVEAANETAIELIIEAGFDDQDSDQLGDECGDVLQTLLAIAVLRCPSLAQVVENAKA